MRHFIRTRLADDVCEIANLNYWAYWLGEVTEPQTSDLFMVNLTSKTWRGTQLLRHLASKLHAGNPYVDVVVHSLWALVMLRPSAVEQGMEEALEGEAGRALDEDGLSQQSRRELEAVVYALRMIRRG
ncbi:hypothetical protein [Nonomuraea typhae]|uniref:Uncharacterized protein n=1 Tax=Nonomuraea typhae TaxID=2603600 RepID=A0ABW7YZB7_9ACTN